MTTQAAGPAQGDNPERPAINAPVGTIFKIKGTEFYVPAVIFSTQGDNKFFAATKDRIQTNYQIE